MGDVGFTGTQHGMTDEQKQRISDLLYGLQSFGSIHPATRFHHGDCIGADVEAARIARSWGYRIIVHPPEAERKRAFNAGDEERTPLPYLERNHAIVHESRDMMLACPAGYDERIRGSGTWATIRFARKVNVPLIIVYPDGSMDG